MDSTGATTGVQTVDVPISSVNKDHSIVIVTSNGSGSTPDKIYVSGQITSSTNISFKRGNGSYSTCSITWTVIEFNNVKSKQSGLTSTSASGIDITLSSINLNKSFANISFYHTATDQIPISCQATLTTNSNLNLITKSNTAIISWEIIEFN